VEQEFSWHQTGKVNIAYEAIDRHAEDPIRGEKCCQTLRRIPEERISYAQMKTLSNRFANVLRKSA
jgi:acetyl-CoA synthetase